MQAMHGKVVADADDDDADDADADDDLGSSWLHSLDLSKLPEWMRSPSVYSCT